MSFTLQGALLEGDHASRPAANAAGLGVGALYSCSDHDLVYQTDGSSWSTWATLGSAASGSITSSGYTQATARLLGRTTASTGAIEEISVGAGLSLSAGSLTATGGSGGTLSYVGKNAIGGTQVSIAPLVLIAKKFTAPADGVLENIQVYCRENADATQGLWMAVYADNAGSLANLIEGTTLPTMALTNNVSFNSTGRWLRGPMGLEMTSGDVVHMAVMWTNPLASGSLDPRMYYDGSGTDRTYTTSGAFMTDGGRFSETNTTRDYSIRGSFLSL